MRIVHFLLLFTYVTSQAGLPLPLPDGGQANVCRCGESCRCSGAMSAVDNGHCSTARGRCCSARRPVSATKSPDRCATKTAERCSAKGKECCRAKDDRDAPPALKHCPCRHDTPYGVAACSDPRLMPRRVSPPDVRLCDWLSLSADPAAPPFTRSPDEPVPRSTV